MQTYRRKPKKYRKQNEEQIPTSPTRFLEHVSPGETQNISAYNLPSCTLECVDIAKWDRVVRACVNGAGSFQIAWHLPVSRGHSWNSTGSTQSPSHPGDHPDTRALSWSRAAQALVSRGPHQGLLFPDSHVGQSWLWPPEPSFSDYGSPAKFGNSSGFSSGLVVSVLFHSLVSPISNTEQKPQSPCRAQDSRSLESLLCGSGGLAPPSPPGMAFGALPASSGLQPHPEP